MLTVTTLEQPRSRCRWRDDSRATLFVLSSPGAGRLDPADRGTTTRPGDDHCRHRGPGRPVVPLLVPAGLPRGRDTRRVLLARRRFPSCSPTSGFFSPVGCTISPSICSSARGKPATPSGAASRGGSSCRVCSGRFSSDRSDGSPIRRRDGRAGERSPRETFAFSRKREPMPLVSITRLRVRSWSYLPAFFFQTLRIVRQAGRADGNLRVALLRDRRNTFWTGTSWSSESAMKAFMHAKPHGPAMRRLLEWCDEAALVHWTQAGPELPSWEEAHRRIQQDGRSSKVNHPSAVHASHVFPAPTLGLTRERRFK